MDSAKNLKNDQQGAIMVIGLFVALSLVASLWFLIGLGDAIIFRDRGQEAADSVALSSATVHARGMNVIAALNIISLALVAFYMILCLVGDILIMVAIVAALIPGGQGVALQLANMAMKPYNFAVNYEKSVLKKALPALGTASTAVAVAAPWLGTAAGVDAAAHYKDSTGTFVGVAVGPSNVPIYKQSGTDKGKTNGGKALDKGEHKVLGLPVSPEKNQTLCVRSIIYPIQVVTNWLRNLIPIPVIGAMIGEAMARAVETLAMAPAWIHCGVDADSLPAPGGVGSVMKKLIDAVDKVRKLGVAIKIPLGDQALWDAEGPKKMAFGNGDTHFLVLGYAMGGEHVDDSERRVMLGAKQFGGGNKTSVHAYNAQAEFFYDCGERWTKMSCNGATTIGSGIQDVGYQNAIYSVRWKARLKRSMNVAEVFARVGLEKGLEYFTGKGYREAYLGTKGNPFSDAVVRYMGELAKGTIKEVSQQGRAPTTNMH